MKVAVYSNHLDGALAILESGFAIVPILPTYIAKLANRKHIREIKIKRNAPVFTEEATYDAAKFLHPPLACLVDRLNKEKY